MNTGKHKAPSLSNSCLCNAVILLLSLAVLCTSAGASLALELTIPAVGKNDGYHGYNSDGTEYYLPDEKTLYLTCSRGQYYPSFMTTNTDIVIELPMAALYGRRVVSAKLEMHSSYGLSGGVDDLCIPPVPLSRIQGMADNR